MTPTAPSITLPSTDDLEVIRCRIEQIATDMIKLSFELNNLTRRMDLIWEFEQFRDVILNRHQIQTDDLPFNSEISAKDFIELGNSLYSLEYSDAGNPFRWTGPGHDTIFGFYINRAVPLFVHIRLAYLGHTEDYRQIDVEVEGHTFKLTPGTSDTEFIAGPLPVRLGNQRTDILIHVPILFCPRESGTDDSRVLGIGISNISVGPNS